ncbi:MAG: hypothetical protein L3J29_07665 [Cyclobacteriaceae bacterium]|nr:hypothetical protein [Cyclobacteriaceae bacterium]
MNQLKHNKQRASLAINIIAGVLIFEVAMLISDFSNTNYYKQWLMVEK